MELDKHSSKCAMGRYIFMKEVQNGVEFNLHFKFHVCKRYQVVASEKELSLDSINNAFVWGALTIGIGHRQADKLLAIMDCLSLTLKQFK